MTTKVKFIISGMHCTSCAMSIDGDLEDYTKGVKSSNTNYAKGETEVTFDTSQVTAEKIIEQIEKIGYSATLAK